MDFRTVTAYPLFAVFDKSICKASRLDLSQHGVCVCFYGKCAELDAVILLFSTHVYSVFHTPPSAAMVSGPALPSGTRPFTFWNALTVFFVLL